MYEIQQPTERIIYAGKPKQRPASTIVLVMAIMYWLSPIDALPFIPIDDMIVMLLALWYSGMFGGDAE